jgi:hypothetical protein
MDECACRGRANVSQLVLGKAREAIARLDLPRRSIAYPSRATGSRQSRIFEASASAGSLNRVTCDEPGHGTNELDTLIEGHVAPIVCFPEDALVVTAQRGGG